eukprot:11023213-Lingulodinium_polyedra.AAC.1
MAVVAGAQKLDPVLVQPAHRASYDDHGPMHGLVARGMQTVPAGGPSVLDLLPIEGPLADRA